MIEVFLDTNNFFRDDFLQSTLAEVVIKGAKSFDIKILIPEIVIDEARRNFASQLNDKTRKYKESHKDLSGYIKLPDVSINLNDAIDEYNKFLDNLSTEHEIVILPYPEISIKEIVAAAYEAEKPFKENGNGFKDYIIWQTIKNYCDANSNTGERFFITTDNDFCEEKSKKKPTLHPNLVASLKNFWEAPVVIPTLKDFFDLKIKPSLNTLNAKNIFNFDIEKKAESILEKELLDYAPAGFDGLPFDPDIYISCAEDVVINKAPQISQVEKNSLLINVGGTVCITVEGSMDKINYEYAMEQDIYIESSDIRDYHMLVSKYITTPFELDILYSTKDKKILNHTITLLDEVYHDSYG